MERSLVAWSIRALLMAMGTGLVVGGLRVRTASALHRAWTAALVAMLLLPAWSEWGPSVTAPILPAVRESASHAEMPLGAIEAIPRTPVSQAAAAEPAQSAPRPAGPDWRSIMFGVYLAGIAVMLARLIRGMLQVRSLQRGAGQAEGFVASPLCASPLTIGWLRPVPCLPDNWRTWPAAKLEAILIHEREHARRRDPLVQWLALANRCVFWFHPLAWWLERKLAALAEEACDAAVLGRGYAAHDYARYLIEIARSVNQAGARVRWAGVVAFSAGNLPRRIRRIMDAPPMAAMSRVRSATAASLCALTLAIFLACSPGRPSKTASGRRIMTEQERVAIVKGLEQRRQRERQQQQQSDAAAWEAARTLTPSGAKELEADVKAPVNKLLVLVRYYQSRQDWGALDGLTLWFIGQHPDMRADWGSRPMWDQVWDQDGYQRGRDLWTEQLKKPWTSPFVYMNAGEYLSGNDNEQAEQALLEGRRRFPSSALHWEVFLARHYAWALAGSTGQLPAGQVAVARAESIAPPAQGAYAENVRQRLLASKDTELLLRTVEQLQGNRSNMEFSRSLIERVLAIEPENAWAHGSREHLLLFAVQFRAQSDPGSLSDADRIILLQGQLMRPDAKDGETKANELLALASHHANDANYGSAIFVANMELGEVVLSRGDKAEAVRHLLAASDAPPTEFLRYDRIDMSLARKLVDAGERDAVEKFLDRCAKFSKGGQPLAEWSAQLSKGINPDLEPSFSVFRRTQ